MEEKADTAGMGQEDTTSTMMEMLQVQVSTQLYTIVYYFVQGLKEIQAELRNCQNIVEEKVENISSTIRNDVAHKVENAGPNLPVPKSDLSKEKIALSETDDFNHVDEVFEAYIPTILSDTFAGEEMFEEKKENKHSLKVLKELKTVLVSKQREWEVREAKALARQNGEVYNEKESVAAKGETGESSLPDSPDHHLSLGSSDSSCTDSDSGKEMMKHTQPVGHEISVTHSLAAAAVAKCLEMRTDCGQGEYYGESDNSWDQRGCQ